MQEILDKLKKINGKIGFYYCEPDRDFRSEYQSDLPLIAASVIKIPIMIEAFRRFEDGSLPPESIYILKNSDKMPSCGALNRMHAGLQITFRDLVELMIILSDNTATNILIDHLGIDNINKTMASYGVQRSSLNRKLFDYEAAAKGINNYVTAGDIGLLYEKLYHGEIISPTASKEMLGILAEQRLNGKFPFYLESLGIDCAHKTGEDDQISHDTGIIYSKHPFILCMMSNETDVPAFERLMQDTALELALKNNK